MNPTTETGPVKHDLVFFYIPDGQSANIMKGFLEGIQPRLSCGVQIVNVSTQSGRSKFEDVTEGDTVTRFPLIVKRGGGMSYHNFSYASELSDWLKSMEFLPQTSSTVLEIHHKDQCEDASWLADQLRALRFTDFQRYPVPRDVPRSNRHRAIESKLCGESTPLLLIVNETQDILDVLECPSDPDELVKFLVRNGKLTVQ